MSIPNPGAMQRRPTHPGEMLREDVLPDYGLSVAGLAEALGVSRQTVNELLRERRALSPEMALRLSRLFGTIPSISLRRRAPDRRIDLTRSTLSVVSSGGSARGSCARRSSDSNGSRRGCSPSTKRPHLRGGKPS